MYKHKDGVTLRKLDRSDLPQLLELKQESWWGTHKTLILNQEDQDYWFEQIASDQLYMIGEVNSCSIGVAVYTDIDWIGRVLRIGGSIYPSQRQAKVSTAAFCAGMDFAFEILNMHRVEAEVLEYHAAARFLEIDKLGMVIEGRKRKAVYKSGRYYDSLVLGLLRDEWLNQARVTAYGDSCNLNFSHSDCERFIKRTSPTMPQA